MFVDPYILSTIIVSTGLYKLYMQSQLNFFHQLYNFNISIYMWTLLIEVVERELLASANLLDKIGRGWLIFLNTIVCCKFIILFTFRITNVHFITEGKLTTFYNRVIHSS